MGGTKIYTEDGKPIGYIDDNSEIRLYVSSEDFLAGYEVADTIDTGAFPRYHAYVDKHENWFIIEENTTSLRYFSGSGSYPAAWAGRAGHVYDYFYNIY